MPEAALIVSAVLLLAVIVLLVLILRRTGTLDLSAVEAQLTSLKDDTSRIERAMREELAKNREEGLVAARHGREELAGSINAFSESLGGRMVEIAQLQQNQLDIFGGQLNGLGQALDQRVERLRETVEARLRTLQEDNSQKLEQMRATVDEKLHATLEHRLGESFQLVSDRLERVYQGLGEMQSLASGVGDLKKVLTNIKTRGTWGEVQLGALLDQVLTTDQYARNIATKEGSSDRVEFAIKLPGRSDADGSSIWLPIDAKFPQEDFQRLVDAQEQASQTGVEEAGKMLEIRIKGEAKSIREKYIDPPHTTEFAIMFLPTEGLYAEVIRRTGLCEVLQREYRVTVAGPTTLTALLNSLQMGFRTLAIEKRSSEVWALLGAVKTEFGRFGEVLEKTKKKLEEASSTIESASVRSRQIEKKLRDVQQLPAGQADRLIGPTVE